MQVKIHELYPDIIQTYQGTAAEIHDQLIAKYTWLNRFSTVKEMVRALDRAQAYAAQLIDDNGPDKGTDNKPVIQPVTASGQEFANKLQEAYAAGLVMPVQLSGKHSAGAMVAHVPNDCGYLLKPDSGGQSPAKGAKEESATQSAREACFYAIAKDNGMEKFFCEAQWIIVNDKHYAMMRMLPMSYTTMERRAKTDPSYPTRLFLVHLHTGDLHRWAFLDFALGNCDRHINNIMVNDSSDLKLIDQGSAFAGRSFSPGHDDNTFVPYYLRAWCGAEFHKMSPEQKLAKMPRVNASVAQELKQWVDTFAIDKLAVVCNNYGINAQPHIDLIYRMRNTTEPVDLVLNRMWIGLQ